MKNMRKIGRFYEYKTLMIRINNTEIRKLLSLYRIYRLIEYYFFHVLLRQFFVAFRDLLPLDRNLDFSTQSIVEVDRQL